MTPQPAASIRRKWDKEADSAFVLGNPEMTIAELAAHFETTTASVVIAIYKWRKAGLIPKDFTKLSCRKTKTGILIRRKVEDEKTRRKINDKLRRECYRRVATHLDSYPSATLKELSEVSGLSEKQAGLHVSYLGRMGKVDMSLRKTLREANYKASDPNYTPRRPYGEKAREMAQREAFVLDNPTLPTSAYAKAFGCTLRAVGYTLKKLRAEGKYHRPEPQAAPKKQRAVSTPPESKPMKPKPLGRAIHPPNKTGRVCSNGKAAIFTTTQNPSRIFIHNRDREQGKVLVRIDSRTQKYVWPHEVGKYKSA